MEFLYSESWSPTVHASLLFWLDLLSLLTHRSIKSSLAWEVTTSTSWPPEAIGFSKSYTHRHLPCIIDQLYSLSLKSLVSCSDFLILPLGSSVSCEDQTPQFLHSLPSPSVSSSLGPSVIFFLKAAIAWPWMLFWEQAWFFLPIHMTTSKATQWQNVGLLRVAGKFPSWEMFCKV